MKAGDRVRVGTPLVQIDPEKQQATVRGTVTAETARRLAAGIELDGRRTARARVRVLHASPRRSVVELVLHEGRKRQVRRMLEAVGHPVLALHRLRNSRLQVRPAQAAASRRALVVL